MLRVSNKPTMKKIRNFWLKIWLWMVIFSNRGLLWLYGVWQNKAQRVPEHLQRVSLLDKVFIIICVKGRCWTTECQNFAIFQPKYVAQIWISLNLDHPSIPISIAHNCYCSIYWWKNLLFGQILALKRWKMEFS